MNNEPVAWMNIRTSKCVVFINTPPSDDWIPLYTHPAKTLTDDPLVNFKPVWQEKPELTLTDEEIEQIGKEYGIKSVYQFAYYEFARAILRKAQENG